MPSCADLVGPALGALTAVQAPAPFACLRVHGPDATDFLQRLCSQDVAGLADGEALPAAFLTAKGRLETLAFVGRLGADLCIETQRHELAKLAELLERYHFTERLGVEPWTDRACWQVVGPQAFVRAEAKAGSVARAGDSVRFAGSRRGLQWVRWHGAQAPALPELPRLDEAQWQCLRIAAGVPWMGLDADGTTLALEADIDDHVSTSKGCYTGQEIVARIHTYGHTNRRLCRLRVTPDGAPLVPGTVIADPAGEPVGRLTSVAELPGAAVVLALGYLSHQFATAGTQLPLAGRTASVEVC